MGIDVILAIWLHSMEPTDAEIRALVRTDPVDLTYDSARENILYAREAGQLYGVDPSVLLAIAWHESRYHPRTQTREPAGLDEDGRYRRHRVSCGVMTPVPKARCAEVELTLEGGYVAGAAHLRMYLDVHHGSLEKALVAYAGGSGSVRYPKAGWRAWRAKRQELERAKLLRRPDV